MRLLAKEVSSYSKVFLLLTALLFILLINLGSSAPLSTRAFSCDSTRDSLEIFSISSKTNAHGQLKSFIPEYDIEICYDELFNGAFTAPAPSGSVLKLSSQSNAHGADFRQLSGAYTQTVSYESLICRTFDYTSDNSLGCNNDEAFVIAMPSTRNSHFSVVRSLAYPVAVCCKSSSGGIIIDPKAWCGNGVPEEGEQCDLGDPSIDPNGRNGVAGSGCSTTCTTTGDPSGYLECRNSQCFLVLGSGTNRDGCSVAGNPCTDTEHLACVNNACAIVNSPGNNLNGCNITGQACGTTPTCGTSNTVCEASDSCTCSECVSVDRCLNPVTITSAVWKNESGRVTSGPVGIGQRVFAEVNLNPPITGPATIRIDIYEYDNNVWPLSDGYTLLNSGNAQIDYQGTSGGARATYEFVITDNHFNLGKQGGVDNTNQEYVFNATIIDSNPLASKMSGELEVNSGIIVTNQKPNAEIDSPKEGQAYFYCNDVVFNQTSSDPEDEIDELRYGWDIGASIGNKNSLRNFTHQYGLSNTGQKNVKLTVTDTGNLKDSDSLSFMVAGFNGGPGKEENNTELYSYIKRPAVNEDVDCRLVGYNGSGSYAIRINKTENNNIQVICVAGDCPAQMAGPNCIEGTNNIGQTINIERVQSGYNGLIFNWTFDRGSIEENAKVSGKRVYESDGLSMIKLITKYDYNNDGIKRSSALNQTNFRINRVMGNGSCSYNGQYFVDRSGVRWPTTTEGVCSMGGQGTSCCPQGSVCDDGQCKASECILEYNNTAITRCDQYNLIEASNSEKKIQCESDCNYAFRTDSPSGATSKSSYINEGCVWDSTSNTCEFAWLNFEEGVSCEGHTQLTCIGSQCTLVSQQEGLTSCTSNTDCTSNPQPKHLACVDRQCKVVDGIGENACSFDRDCQTSGPPSRPTSCSERRTPLSSCGSDGYMRYNVECIPLNAQSSCAGCTPGEVSIPCRSNVIELPFFGSWQFGLSLVLISILYIVMFRRKVIEKFFK